jgi:hypothetical protein
MIWWTLRRGQTCAVEQILGDLRADPERHLGVLHHPDQILGGPVSSHDQPLRRTPPDLRCRPAVLIADHSAVLGLPPASAAVRARAVAADDRFRK